MSRKRISQLKAERQAVAEQTASAATAVAVPENTAGNIQEAEEEPVPAEAAQEEQAPEEIRQEESVPEGAAQEEQAPEETAQEEPVPAEAAQEEPAPEETAQEEAAPVEAVQEEAEEPSTGPLVRAFPDPAAGLTALQVQNRIENGAVNTQVESGDTTLGDIIRRNVLTYFNLIFLIIAVFLCIVGSFRDLTFLPVILANTLIGIVQEWRSKKLLDKLTIMNAPQTRTVRDGKECSLTAGELVLDDIVIFEAGNQIPADAIVEEGGVSVNESLLTGEADEISKQKGDLLMSGSFIVSGTCRARLDRVGEDSYISRLTLEAKASQKGEQSEMIRSLDRLVKIVGILIIPISIILFTQQFHFNHQSLRASVTSTAAAILGMIPEGLYLLASVAMAVSAMRLAMGKVLVHNMKSIETLARVDVLCVDKTGTITENTMTVRRAVPVNRGGTVNFILKDKPESEDLSYLEDAPDPDPQHDAQEESFSPEELASLELSLGDFAQAMSADNITMKAIKSYFTKNTGRRAQQVFPFSSMYKYSGAVFEGQSYVLGAPELLMRDAYPSCREQVETYTCKGYRVLLFGEYEGTLDGGLLQNPVRPIGLILLSNPIRENAPETFRYFEEQGVTVKVISGDNPMTVSEVAQQAGIAGADRFVDVTGMQEDALAEAAEQYTVFGRVQPDQKRILVRAMKKAGHTVAMTGDGVNDVLALKDADCSVAMASGSDAATHAAQMVLLESDFSRMPSVVSEGRRVVNNIERTASLFLVKNIFSILMSVFSIIFMMNYPLEPSQVSLISMFTIGIPAFCMALETNTGRIQGHFLSNVFFKALPAGLTDFAVISALVVFCREFRVSSTDMSTSCTILLAIVGIMILYRIASPMTKFHWLLWFAMIFGILFGMTFLNHIFAISMLSRKCAMLLIIFAIITEPAIRYLSILVAKIWYLCGKIRKKWGARFR